MASIGAILQDRITMMTIGLSPPSFYPNATAEYSVLIQVVYERSPFEFCPDRHLAGRRSTGFGAIAKNDRWGEFNGLDQFHTMESRAQNVRALILPIHSAKSSPLERPDFKPIPRNGWCLT
jgi:hypothetical protein